MQYNLRQTNYGLKLILTQHALYVKIAFVYLVCYYKSRRKAADAVRALYSSSAREHLQDVAVCVGTNGEVFVATVFSPTATEVDRVRVEGILAGGHQTDKDFTELMASLKSYREIYIGNGTEMFRGHGWGAARG